MRAALPVMRYNQDSPRLHDALTVLVLVWGRKTPAAMCAGEDLRTHAHQQWEADSQISKDMKT